MGMTLFLHIVGGGLGLLSGYIALYSSKGEPLHRRSGRVFVYAMTVMTLFGAWVALAKNNQWTPMNFSAGIVTFYLVVTAMTTVKPLARGARAVHIAALVVAMAFALTDLTFGIQAIANGGKRNGVPAFPYLMFGFAALFGGIGDIRVLRSGPLQGSRRIARHLWRMTFALFIAALSFFIGQARVIPKPIRIPGLLAIPVVAVLVTLIYWMWRIRRKPSARNAVAVAIKEKNHANAVWSRDDDQFSRFHSRTGESAQQKQPADVRLRQNDPASLGGEDAGGALQLQALQ